MFEAPGHPEIQGNKLPDTSPAPARENERSRLDEIDFSGLANDTRDRIESVAMRVFQGEISVIESAVEMGRITRAALESIAATIAERLDTSPDSLPFGIFLFGSTARNLMLPNSDLDVILVFQENCPEEIRTAAKKALGSLPFEDTEDIEIWNERDMRKENCPSLMQWNKAVEASFVAGGETVAEKHRELVTDRDSRQDKEVRFMTEFWLLHKADYRGRASEHGPSLKYDFGGSRDIVFLDWYYQLENPATETERPTAELCLDWLLENSTISSDEHKELKSALELVLLVKFSLWTKSAETNDNRLLYLSDLSLDECFLKIKPLLAKKGIDNPDQLSYAYYRAKGKLHQLVTDLFELVAERNPDTAKLWKIAEGSEELTEDVRKILDEGAWSSLVPFAIASSSPEILGYIVKAYSNKKGFEYILRLVSQNRNITMETRRDLMDSRLDDRIKKKMRNMIEE